MFMKFQDKHPILLGSLAALTCESLFGLSYLFTKSATSQSSPLALLGWRFLLAFLIMQLLVTLGWVKLTIQGKSLGQLVKISFFSPVLYFIGETFGIKMTTASESGAFLATIPVIALMASSILLREKPNRHQVMGIGLTLVGVLFTVFALGLSASFSIPGYLMLILAVIGYAFYSVHVEKATAFSGADMTYLMLLVGGLVFPILALVEAVLKHQLYELLLLPIRHQAFSIAVLYQALACSVIAFFLSNFAISKIGVNKAASFIGVSTLVSILAAVLFLGEAFSQYQTFGAFLIILGVYLTNIPIKQNKP